MSNDILSLRNKQLEELTRFTQGISSDIATITSAIGWTVKSITNNDDVVISCPYNASHSVPEHSLASHLAACQWKAEGYRETDLPLSEPTLPPGTPSSIYFDEQLQNKVLQRAKEQDLTARIGSGERLIPRTSHRLIADFTTDERKALYEYAIANTVKPEIGADIADINNLDRRDNEEKQMSLIELLVQERNLKRRRAKHKGIHTNKKSHLEILRELITQQMEVYADYMASQNSRPTHDVNTYDRPTKADDRLNYSHETYSKLSTHHSNSFSKGKNGHRSTETEDYCHERFIEDSQHRSRQHKRSHHKSQEYEGFSPGSRKAAKKRKHSERRSRSRSLSRDQKSHKKKSKHHSKEDRHKKKKHKSNSNDRDSLRHREHRRKDKTRYKDL